jgi:hypothetical protein
MANPDTLGYFLDIMNNPMNPHYQDYNYLVDTYFCPDNSKLNPTIPCVGITDHGPAFYGRAATKLLFQRLFATFNPMRWVYPPPTAPSAPQLVSADLNTIGIQMTVRGTFQAPWFAIGSGHESAPLTQLTTPTGSPLGRYRQDTGGLPAVAVFTFNAQNLIQQLQIYTDRYALMMSITTARWDPEAVPAPNPVHSSLPAIAGRDKRITITIDD